jgi:hypothetical protein
VISWPRCSVATRPYTPWFSYTKNHGVYSFPTQQFCRSGEVFNEVYIHRYTYTSYNILGSFWFAGVIPLLRSCETTRTQQWHTRRTTMPTTCSK